MLGRCALGLDRGHEGGNASCILLNEYYIRITMIVCYIIMVILHVIVHRGCNFGSQCFLIDGSKVLILACISIVVAMSSQLITNFH